MQSELEQYEFQLEQVQLALESDPHNLELKKLVHDLQELIDLSKQLHPSSSSSSSSTSNHHHHNNKVKSKSKPSSFTPFLSTSPRIPSDSSTLSSSHSHPWKVGDRVLAQWHDQQWYEATVTAISTKWSEHEPLYSVVFTGYTNVEIKPSSSLRPLSFSSSSSSNSVPNQAHSLSPSTLMTPASIEKHNDITTTATWMKESTILDSSISSMGSTLSNTTTTTTSNSSSSSSSSNSSNTALSKPRFKKKTKQEFQLKHQKRQTKLAQLEKVHQQAQQSWLHFASGGTGSGPTHHPLKKAKATVSSLQPIPILKKKSMFATPDNPYAKVGVIGSGQGMTEFHDRGKHKFDYLE